MEKSRQSPYLQSYSDKSEGGFESQGEDANGMLSVAVWREEDANRSYARYVDNSFRDETAAAIGISGKTAALEPEDYVAQEDIAVGSLSGASGASKFKGRKTLWPGAFFLILLIGGSIAALTIFGIKRQQDSSKQENFNKDRIKRGTRISKPLAPALICGQPNFVTEGAEIFAESPDGKTRSKFRIAGINWSGMENPEGIPHGLAFGQSSLEEIASSLKKAKFNAVRLPLNAKGIVKNSTPDKRKFLDEFETPELNVKTYIEVIQQVVQGLGREKIAVLLDIHKLNPNFKIGGGENRWFTPDFEEKDFNNLIDILGKKLCSEKYWNIIGLDIKNEPSDGCWPNDNNDATCTPSLNWPLAAGKLGSRMLSKCKNWLIFVEGVYAQDQKLEIDGTNETYFYNDWEGASLQNAPTNPVKLSIPNKLVYAPHFYSPSTFPASYYFIKSEVSSNTFTPFPSTSTGTIALKNNIEKVMKKSFGEIAETVPTVLGEFGGIYGVEEIDPTKTSTRAIDKFIEMCVSTLAGGFVWSLNPDSNYDFNGVYNPLKPFQYGVFQDGYKKLNSDYLKALTTLKGDTLPCFKRKED